LIGCFSREAPSAFVKPGNGRGMMPRLFLCALFASVRVSAKWWCVEAVGANPTDEVAWGSVVD